MSEPPEDTKDYFQAVLEHGRKFCAATGLDENFPIRIYQASSDWTFILQIDALHEMACREIAFSHPNLKRGNKNIPPDERRAYVDKLPINGDRSLISFLKSNEIQPDLLSFVSNVRKIRNEYAHNIRNIDTPLLSTIQRQSDASQILVSFSALRPEAYREEEVLKRLASTPGMLRFEMLCESLRFLTFAHFSISHLQGISNSPM